MNASFYNIFKLTLQASGFALILSGTSMAQTLGDGADDAQPSRNDVGFNENYFIEQHDKWVISCVKIEETPDICQAAQQLYDAVGTQLASISLFIIPEGEAGAQNISLGTTIVVPLESFLPANMQLVIEDAEPLVYVYQFCSAAGCFVQAGFGEENIALLKKGREAVISIVPAFANNREQIDMKVSLIGLTKALKTLNALEAPQAQ